MTDKTIAERIEERKQREQELHDQLAALNLDGPHRLPSEGFGIGSFLGGTRDQYAICLTCGAVVMLNDPEVSPVGEGVIERSVRIHTAWHEPVTR